MRAVRSVICLVLMCFSVHGWSFGNEGAEGGDDIGLEFEFLARTIGKDVDARYPDLKRRFNLDRYFETIDKGKVIVVEIPLTIEVEGHVQDSVALNVPAKGLIYVSRERWKAISSERIKKGIVFHEYLSLIGSEKTGDYQISSEYMGLLGEKTGEDVSFFEKLFASDYQCNQALSRFVVSRPNVQDLFISLYPNEEDLNALKKFAKNVGIESFADITGIELRGVLASRNQEGNCRVSERGLISILCGSPRATELTLLRQQNQRTPLKLDQIMAGFDFSAKNEVVNPIIRNVMAFTVYGTKGSSELRLDRELESPKCRWIGRNGKAAF